MQDDTRQAQMRSTGLGYIARGWRVITLHHILKGRCSCAFGPRPSDNPEHDYKTGGKHPQPAGWQLDYARDADAWNLMCDVAVRDFWGFNVGIVTGAASGIWVLDIDPENGGDVALRQLELQHGALPQTYTVRTGSGGQQLYWLLPLDGFVPTNSNRLPSGIDTRGSGGQVVAPPSISGKGSYLVLDDRAPVHAPEWLLSHIRPLPPREPTPPVSGAGQRDGSLTATDDPRLAAYVIKAVESECQRLADAAVGDRGTMAHKVALNLIEFINAPWAALDGEQVWCAYLLAADWAERQGGNFNRQEATSSWESAQRKVGTRGRDLPTELAGPTIIDIGQFSPTGAAVVPPFSYSADGWPKADPASNFPSILPATGPPPMPNLAPLAIPGQRVAPEPMWQGPPAAPAAAFVIDTWQPVDMSRFTDGSFERPRPTLGWRTDGLNLLYQGKEHLIMGESESGKTWLALWIIKDCLLKGYPVAIVDFEDDPSTFASRLMVLGVPAKILNDPTKFAYVNPDRRSTPADIARLLSIGPYVVMLDGKQEGYGLHGWRINENDDAVKWRQNLVVPFKRSGAAVIEVAHVPKGGDTNGRGPLGGVHQLNGIDGVIYRVNPREPFAPGRKGSSSVYVAKDRPGGVKEHLETPADGKLFFAGIFVLDTTPGSDWPGANLFAPKRAASATETDDFGLPVGSDGPDPLAPLKQSVSGYAAQFIQQGVTGRVIEDSIGGSRTKIAAALAEMERDGFLRVEPGLRGARQHFLVRPWSADAQLDANRERVATVAARFRPSGDDNSELDGNN